MWEAKQLNISFERTLKFVSIRRGISGTICMKSVNAFVATFELGSFDCFANTYITLVFNLYWESSFGKFFTIAAIFDRAVCLTFHSVVSQDRRSSSSS